MATHISHKRPLVHRVWRLVFVAMLFTIVTTLTGCWPDFYPTTYSHAEIPSHPRVLQLQPYWCWAACSQGILSSCGASTIVFPTGASWTVSQPNLALLAFPGSPEPPNLPVPEPVKVAQVITGTYATSAGTPLSISGQYWGGYWYADPSPQVATALVLSIKSNKTFLFACGTPDTSAHAYLAWGIDWEENNGRVVRVIRIYLSDPWSETLYPYPVYDFNRPDRPLVWGGVWAQVH
jgi:hypothetical protein